MSKRRKHYFWRDTVFTALVILSMGMLLAIAFDVQMPWTVM
ncbi:hypothetical protein [Pelagibius sp. Alg239-R121]|nr:hypothetical protein [Pelagibius sp. Alg239-R121]